MATVEVRFADVEPVAGFIARVIRADAGMRCITAEQAAGLPAAFAAAWGELQDAIADLSACLPSRMATQQADATV